MTDYQPTERDLEEMGAVFDEFAVQRLLREKPELVNEFLGARLWHPEAN